MKIGNTSFNVEAIKKMTRQQFEKTYAEILKGQDLKSVYEQITKEPAKAAGDGDNVG